MNSELYSSCCTIGEIDPFACDAGDAFLQSNKPVCLWFWNRLKVMLEIEEERIWFWCKCLFNLQKKTQTLANYYNEKPGLGDFCKLRGSIDFLSEDLVCTELALNLQQYVASVEINLPKAFCCCSWFVVALEKWLSFCGDFLSLQSDNNLESGQYQHYSQECTCNS